MPPAEEEDDAEWRSQMMEAIKKEEDAKDAKMEDEKDEVKTDDEEMKDEEPPASQPRQNMREADEPQAGSSSPGLTALATTQPFRESYANEDLKEDDDNERIEDEERQEFNPGQLDNIYAANDDVNYERVDDDTEPEFKNRCSLCSTENTPGILWCIVCKTQLDQRISSDEDVAEAIDRTERANDRTTQYLMVFQQTCQDLQLETCITRLYDRSRQIKDPGSKLR